MHQRIPRWKFICWCSQFWKHCIWICTKGTLQFIWVLLSLAFVVKEGEIYCHILLKFVWKRKLLCNSFTEGDYWKRENFLVYWRKMCFQISFCYDMLCCHQCQRGRLLDTIDNCVLSLMLHKCHIRYQSSTELSHSANAADSVHRVHSVTKGSR